ncbi:MAG: DUF1540 domain-containing protein [Bacillota bacterium]
MNRIKCSVSTCKYNDDGAVCQADEIKVRNNFGATDNMEIGSLEGESGARTTTETCCETFAPKKNK